MPAARNRLNTLPAACAVAACVVAAPCLAAGPWIAETGGADMGLAGAGRAALALDAASLSANPAAMGALTDSIATVAVVALDLDYSFNGTEQMPTHATNHEGVAMLPAAFAVHRAGSLTFGIGAYSHLGLSFDSGNDWGGQRAVEQAGVATFNLAPAVAWVMNEHVTVGASLAAQYAEPELRVAVANDALFYGPPAGLPDGTLTASGDSWALGGQLGILYVPRGDTRLGLAWTASVDHSVPLDLEAKNLHPVLATLVPSDDTARLELALPQQLLFGLAYEPRGGTLVSFGLTWQDWSRTGDTHLDLQGGSASVFPGGLRDTWGAAAGMRRSLDEDWSVSAGVSYESSPAPEAGVPAYFPVAEQWKFAAGVERNFGKTLRLRGSVSVTQQGDAQVVQTAHPLPLPGIPGFTGVYADTRVFVVSLAADFGR